MRLWTAAMILAAGPALAEAPMDAAAFAAYAEGRTLAWSLMGQPFGTERYAPGNRVIWAGEGGACQAGSWRQEGQNICFDYDEDGGDRPVCWRIARDADGVHADLIGGETPLRLTVMQEKGVLICPDYGS